MLCCLEVCVQLLVCVAVRDSHCCLQLDLVDLHRER